MSISILNSPACFLLALLTFAGGCASSLPPAERDLARDAVRNASLAGAEKMAIEEYSEASNSLNRGEALLKQGDDEEARAVLSDAIIEAHQAEVTTYIRTLNLAENRIQQLEIQKETLLKAWRAAIADQEAIIDFTSDEESHPKSKSTSSICVRIKATFVKFSSRAVLAPRQNRAPLMSIPI